MSTHWSDNLRALNACNEAIEWCRTTASLDEAWAKCTRGDWMIWLAVATETDRRQLTFAALQCARLALPHAGAYAATIEVEIVVIEAWTRGEADDANWYRARSNLQKIDAASYAASYAASDARAASYAARAASYAAASAASYAASYAARAASDASYAASYAARAASDAASAASYAASAASLAKCANSVRENLACPKEWWIQ